MEDRPLCLAAHDLRKRFQRETKETVEALDGISLAVRKGTLTALVGPDGAGKTTLLRLASGLIAPDGGSIEVVGLDVTAAPQAVQDRIGYMPQRFGLYEDLSVQENLDLYADLHGVSHAERRTVYPRLFEMTQLGPFKARPAGKLSGGTIVGSDELSDIPATRRFFLGGGGTVRGYGYQEISPRNGENKLLGGRSYMAASAEVRIGITETIGIVPFIDVGTVSTKEVALGPVLDGGLRVIRGGLSASDRVVIEGTQMAMPGSKVRVHTGRLDPPKADKSAAATAEAPPGAASIAG